MDNQQDKQPVVFEHEISETYIGPLPNPLFLEKYKNTDPSFPERIMKMAEAHNAADVTTKNRISLSHLITPIMGQVITFFLGAGGIFACIYLARAGYTGPSIAAVASAFSPIAIRAIRSIRNKVDSLD